MSHHSPPTVEPIDVLFVEGERDDSRSTREAFANGRIRNEFQVVADSSEARDFVSRCGDDGPRPDVILLDLARDDGEEVLEELETDPDCAGIPIVVLTASDAIGDATGPATDHVTLSKPIDPDAFVDAVCSFEEFWLSVVCLPLDERAG